MNILRLIFWLTFISGVCIYIYQQYYLTQCDRIINYDIGQFDERFGISRDEFLKQVESADRTWERQTGNYMFEYKAGAEFKINLIFSEAQEKLNKSTKLIKKMEKRQAILEANKRSIEARLAQHKTRSANYEQAVNTYNKEVSHWNGMGGMSVEQIQKFNDKKQQLANMQRTMQNNRREVNELIKQHEQATQAYNKEVNAYNKLVGNGERFQSGTTNGKEINIYFFKDKQQLYSTLAHEFGHVLGIEHVNQTDAVMYALMNDENREGVLTQADTKALEQVCRPKMFRWLF